MGPGREFENPPDPIARGTQSALIWLNDYLEGRELLRLDRSQASRLTETVSSAAEEDLRTFGDLPNEVIMVTKVLLRMLSSPVEASCNSHGDPQGSLE